MMAQLSESGQLSLFGPYEEAQLYLSQKTGFFSLLYSAPTASDPKRKKQESYRLSALPEVLQGVDKNRDTWISQAEFFAPNRRVVNLARIGLCFVDLDYYTIRGYENENPESILYRVFLHCEANGIPVPNLVISSGRGLQLKWVFEAPIPRQALPRWRAVQNTLTDALEKYGADQRAKDASRVLRLVQTTNSKSGEVCRVIWHRDFRHDFEQLCEAVLPVERDVVKRHREAADRRRQFRAIDGCRQPHDGLNRFSGRRLAWDRLEDLRLLTELRKEGGILPDQKRMMLFWQLNFLLLSGVVHSSQMFHEASALGRMLDPAMSYGTSDLCTLYHKAQQHNRGETVEFEGKSWPALYTPRNQTLIDEFGVTADEERRLRTIISKGEASERHKARCESYRREAGAVSRREYEAKAQDRARQVKVLKEQGYKGREIAKKLGITAARVSQLLKN